MKHSVNISSLNSAFFLSYCDQNDALSVAAAALEANQEEKDISAHIKTHFDQKYGPTWHCIVGSDFRAFVTHESKHFIFFYIGKTAICLYRA